MCRKRKNADNKFDNKLYKNAMNAVFGKTMENIRERVNVKLVTNNHQTLKYVAKPSFKTLTKFSDHLIAIQMHKIKLCLNRPIYTGFSVLDLSKLCMQKFHYDHIKKKYKDEKSQLLFTDTDSLCYKIETEDIYKDMRDAGFLYDFSNYPKDHPNFNIDYKKRVGKMKDETEGNPVREFVGVRPKVYSMVCENANARKFANKGIRRNQSVSHEKYKYCVLQSRVPPPIRFKQIDSKLHVLRTISKTKEVLNPFANKRYLLMDGVTSKAYGHYSIELSEDVFEA